MPEVTRVGQPIFNYSDEEFCAQPLSTVWLIYAKKAELRKIIEFRGIKRLRGFKGFAPDYRSYDQL